MKFIKIIAVFIGFMCLLPGNDWADNLIDIYKKGGIKLEADPEFGKDIDWAFYIHSSTKNIAVSEKGKIFITHVSRNHICIFDKNGKFIKQFGQKGQGPGDLIKPSRLSILDNKYLVVQEMSPNLRISLFDLEGNFKDIIRIGSSFHDCVALKNNKIAYLKVKHSLHKGEKRSTIYVIDINSKKELKLLSYEDKIQKLSSPKNFITIGPHRYKIFLLQTKQGNLLVGHSGKPVIKIFSPEGKLVNSFKIRMNRQKITEEIKEAFYRANISKNDPPYYVQSVKSTYFPEYTPYFSVIFVDSNSNILVSNYQLDFFTKILTFQVYKSNGDYICDSAIDFKDYVPDKNIIFRENYIIALLREKDKANRYESKLIKINLNKGGHQ